MPRMLVRHAASGPISPAPATDRESGDGCCNAVDVTVRSAAMEPISIRVATRRMALPRLTSDQQSDTQCVDTDRGVIQTITRAGITVQIKTRRVNLPTPPADSEDPGPTRDTNAAPNPAAEERTTRERRAQSPVLIPRAPRAHVYRSVETQANSPLRFHWALYTDWVLGYLQPKTRAALRSAMQEQPSATDGPGYIYAFEIINPTCVSAHMDIKVGREGRMDERFKYWKRHYRSHSLRHLYPGISLKVPAYKKVEKLVHLELEGWAQRAGYYSPSRSCVESNCTTKHKEIFSLLRSFGEKYIDWMVMDIIWRWSNYSIAFDGSSPV